MAVLSQLGHIRAYVTRPTNLSGPHRNHHQPLCRNELKHLLVPLSCIHCTVGTSDEWPTFEDYPLTAVAMIDKDGPSVQDPPSDERFKFNSNLESP